MKEFFYKLWFLILLLGIVLLITENLYGQEVRLEVRPFKCVVPCDVHLALHIPRNKDNRRWSISISNADGTQAEGSQGSMDGEDSESVFPVCTEDNKRPCFRTLRYPDLYLIVGCVYRVTKGKTYCDKQTVEVVGESHGEKRQGDRRHLPQRQGLFGLLPLP